MLAESTIRKQMRALRKIVDNRNRDDESSQGAYDMESALQWVLGGCSWTPCSLAEDTAKIKKS